jgi:hypothetical protein
MPHFRNVSVTNPIVLQAASSFTRISEINVPISSTYGHYSIRGDDVRRGACHFQSDTLTTVLLRGPSLGSSPSIIRSESFTDFYENDFTIGPGTAFANINSLKFIDNYLWILGGDTSGLGKVLAILGGNALEASPNYIDRSVDLPGYPVSLSLIRYAKDAGYIYYPAIDPGGNLMVMRGTNATSPFTNICATVVVPGGSPTAYGVSDSGAVHLMFFGAATYRSLDGGVTWSAISVPLVYPIKDVTYSKKFNRWAIINNASNMIYSSTSNGNSWDNGRWATFASQTFVSWAPNTHLERLDVEGRYILAVGGFNGSYAQIYTYLSEDGGLSWIMSQVLRVPNYDINAVPVNSSIVLVNAGSRVFIYQGNTGDAWNFDNSVFATPIMSFATP